MKNMNIKNKIIFIPSFVIIVLALVVTFVTSLRVNKVILDKTNEELKNYSAMGLTLIDVAFPGDWSLQNGELMKGEASVKGHNEAIDYITNGTNIIATVFAGDTRIATNVVNDAGERQL